MAVLWQTRRNGVTYEVRGAGQSVRLYSNGIFHSQWNSRHVFTGALWDLLTLPGFLLNSSHPLRVLVLGVGGGAVIRQLLALLDIDEIVGVELDRTHLQIAQRWFGLSKFDNVTLQCADVRDWLPHYQGDGFDIVIDDLFGHAEADTLRSVDIDRGWSRQLASVLLPDSVLVVNTVNKSEKQAIADVLRPAIDADKSARASSCVGAGYSLRHPLYDNRVEVLHRSTDPVSTSQWRKRWLEQTSRQVLDKTQMSQARNHLCRASRWYSV